MRLGVDIDDVLVDALPHFLVAFNARFGKAVPLEEADWHIFRAFPEMPPPAAPHRRWDSARCATLCRPNGIG